MAKRLRDDFTRKEGLDRFCLFILTIQNQSIFSPIQYFFIYLLIVFPFLLSSDLLFLLFSCDCNSLFLFPPLSSDLLLRLGSSLCVINKDLKKIFFPRTLSDAMITKMLDGKKHWVLYSTPVQLFEGKAFAFILLFKV